MEVDIKKTIFIVMVAIVGIIYLIKAFGKNLEIILGCIALAVIVLALTGMKSATFRQGGE